MQDIDRISLSDARAFLNRCLNPADYTFIFIGNVNADEIREYSRTFIASIPTSASMNSWTNPQIRRPAEGRRSFNRGRDDRCLVYMVWFAQGPADFCERRNQTAAILSEYIEIIMTNEIRERLGGVYSISSGAVVSTIPSGEYRIIVSFYCNPRRVDELITAVRASITEILNNELNRDIFNMAVEAEISVHQRAIQRNQHIAQSYANSFVIHNTPLNRLYTRPDVIRSITIEEVQALCRQMATSGPVEIVMFPE
jgi:zinc protease